MYHLGCRVGSVEKYALLFGDPDRCEVIKPIIDEYNLISVKRGFALYNGKAGNLSFTFGGIGIGGPSWVIGLHELALSGSELFIRVGTAGIINPDVNPGDIVIADGVISDEGLSRYLVSQDTALVPDYGLTSLLAKSANNHGFKNHVGKVHTKDFLYMEEPYAYPFCEALNLRMQDIFKQGALVSEMECAALFAFGLARGFKTAAVLAAIDDDPEISLLGQQRAILTAIDALISYAGDNNE